MNKKGNYIAQKLLDAGFEAYFVGGCVRDKYLNKTPNDIDLATDATPTEIEEVFEGHSVSKVGARFGTIVVTHERENFEVTTYRMEKYVDGTRKPEVVFGTSIEEDLARRDFTMNAMAMDIHGTLLDPFWGLDDIKSGRIEFVGYANDRIKEDPLRILRAFRFSSQHNLNMSYKTKYACITNLGLLETISRERVRDEFVKMLMGKNLSNLHSFFLRGGGSAYSVLLTAEEWIEFDAPASLITTPHYYKLEMNLSLLTCGLSDAKEFLTRLKFEKSVIKTVLLFNKHINEVPRDVPDLKALMADFNKNLGLLDAYTRLITSKHKINYALMYNTMEHVMDEPMLLTELAIDGNDLKELGLEGESIGVTLKVLLNVVRTYAHLNVREELLQMATEVQEGIQDV